MELHDFELVRGDDFSRVLQFRQNDTPINITTWEVSGHMRPQVDSRVKVTLALTKVDASIGLLRMELTSAQTAALRGVYVWDIEREIDGLINTPVGGKIIVTPDVTRIEA